MMAIALSRTDGFSRGGTAFAIISRRNRRPHDDCKSGSATLPRRGPPERSQDARTTTSHADTERALWYDRRHGGTVHVHARSDGGHAPSSGRTRIPLSARRSDQQG